MSKDVGSPALAGDWWDASEFDMFAWWNSHQHFRGFTSWEGVPRDVLEQQRSLLQLAVPIQTAGPFWGAAIEPNLPVPNVSYGTAGPYADMIRNRCAPSSPTYHTLMGLQLHTGLTPERITESWQFFRNRFDHHEPPAAGFFLKLYLDKVTNSPIGVPAEELFGDQMLANFACAQNLHIPVQIHPEVFCGEGEYFGCESAFMPYLLELHRRFPELLISLEHVSTAELLEGVLSLPGNVVASFTVHHLIGDTSEFWDGEKVYDSFNFCRSVLRQAADRLALIEAIIKHGLSGKLFLGLDDAPHLRKIKLSKGSPGIWLPAWAAGALFLGVCAKHKVPFEVVQAVACENGPRWYRLYVPKRKVKVQRVAAEDPAAKKLIIPSLYQLSGSPLYGKLDDDDPVDGVVPWRARHQCQWQFTPL